MAGRLCAAASPALVVDTTARGEPISPYIYGQFIEHLGRCIYGGIWAEMIEDRKFYFPISANYHPYRSLENTPYPVVGASPWEIVGDPAGVRMEQAGAFVGKHSPLLAAGAAIRQHDLALVQGRKYNGYVWARTAAAGPAEIEVTLAWGAAPSDRQVEKLRVPGTEFARLPFSFTAGQSGSAATLKLRAGPAALVIGTVSLMPADNVHGLRADTLALLKQLRGTVYRWPGGNFTSGYDWRDGIGDRDRRPPRANPAWTASSTTTLAPKNFWRSAARSAPNRRSRSTPALATPTPPPSGWSTAMVPPAAWPAAGVSPTAGPSRTG